MEEVHKKFYEIKHKGEKMKISHIIIILFGIFCLNLPGFCMFLTLVDGTILSGEILENDENKIVFRRWDNQGVIEITWENIHIIQRQQLQKKFGWIQTQEVSHTIPGFTFYLKAGGSITGKVLYRQKNIIKIKTKNAILQIPASNILKEEAVDVPMVDVFKPQELYIEICKRYNLGKADHHLQLAQFLLQISEWEKAKIHFTKAQEMDTKLKPQAEAMQQKMTELIQEQNRKKLFQKYQLYKNTQRFGDALKVVEQLKNFVDAQELERYKQEILTLQKEYLRTAVAQQWARKVQQKIANLAYDRNTLLSDVQKYLLQDLDNDVIVDLTKELQINEADVQNYWENRPKDTLHIHSYQDGTFIVGLKGKNSEKTTTNIPALKLEGWNENRLKTAQEWWDSATSSTRREWMAAFYFENRWEIVRHDLKSCPNCSGKGTQYSMEDIVLCISCHGIKYERIVVTK